MALMVCKGLAFNSGSQQAQIVTVFATPFLILKLLLSRWKQEELIKSGFLIFTGTAVWMCSGKTDTLVAMLLIIACKDIDIYKLFKQCFWIRSLMFFFKVLSALLGFSDMQRVENTRGIEDFRFALGYIHPNAAHYEFFVIVVSALLIWHSRMKTYHYFLLFSCNLLLYSYTLSRTGVIVTFVVLFLTYFTDERKSGVVKRFVNFFGEYAYLFGVICSVLLCFMLERFPVLRTLGTFSYRFIGGNYAMVYLPFSLFGTHMGRFEPDMGLINMMMGRGIVVFLLFLFGMTRMLKEFRKRKMYVEECIGVAYAIYSMTEAGVNTVMMNMMFPFFAYLVFPGAFPSCEGIYLENENLY